MAEKKNPEVISDNQLADVKVTVSAAELLAFGVQLGSQTANQSTTAASSVKDNLKDAFSTFSEVVKSDIDVGGAEVNKSANAMGAAAIVASMAAKVVDSNLQSTVAAWNAIGQSQIAQNNLVTAGGTTLNALTQQMTAMQKEIDTLLVQPYPYAEMAPASQDTGGEGDDTGDTDE